MNLIACSLFLVSLAAAKPYIIGGQSVGAQDPVRASTVGIYSPSPTGGGSLCTGTLIRRDVALTAAHCVSPKGPPPLVVFGRNLHAKSANARRAQGVVQNPSWSRRAGRGMDQGDIALVKFPGGLPKGYRRVSTVRSERAIRDGQVVTLAGYGISDARARTGAGRLRRTRVRVADARPGRSEMIVDQSRGHGACHGDSGGPAFVERNGHVTLAGVTNRSHPASAPDDCAHQAVYTKVPAYQKWIRSSVRRWDGHAPRGELKKRLKTKRRALRR